MAKRNKKNTRRKSLLFFLLIACITVLTFSMYKYWEQIFSNNREKKDLEDKYQLLLAEEEKLENEIVKLQDPDYVARYARENYLYSKDGETIIRIVE